MMRRVSLVAVALTAFLAAAGVAYGYTPAPPYVRQDCVECHEVTLQAPVSRVVFNVPTVMQARCRTCHGMSPDSGIHQKVVDSPACKDCHGDGTHNANPAWAGAWVDPVAGRFAGPSSLLTPAPSLHAIHLNASWIELPSEFGNSPNVQWCKNCHLAAACSACHGEPDPTHVSHVGAQPSIEASYNAVPAYVSFGLNGALNNVITANYANVSVTCFASACHPQGALQTSAALPRCESCHAAKTASHGYIASQHSADVTYTVDVGGKTCGDCHEMELFAEHQRASSSSKAAGCTACHPAPRSSLGTWGRKCSEAGCHSAGSATQPHAGIASGHALLTIGAAAECAGCHNRGDLAVIHANATSTIDPARTSCLVCHSKSAVPVTKDCTTCHFTYAGHPYPAASHLSTSTLTACGGSGCHGTRDLLGVHTEKNPAYTCATCHASARAEVKAAIAAGKTGCGDCHPGVTESSAHAGLHWANPLLVDGAGPHYGYVQGSTSTSPSGDCIGCHTSNLIAEHMGEVDPATGAVTRSARRDSTGAALTCATCHSALPGTMVATAIAGKLTRCDACHVVHRSVPESHTSTYTADPQVPCSPCHSSQIDMGHSAVATTTPSGKSLTGCELCHGYYEGLAGARIQAAISVTRDTGCNACHDAVPHADKGGHNASSTPSLGCGTCHTNGAAAIDVRGVHANAAAGPCAVCHENPLRVASITAKNAECASCHSVAGTDYHRQMLAKHTYTAMPRLCASAGCHPGQTLPDAHQAYIGKQSLYSSTCELCHRNKVAGRIPATATAACDSCHVVHPNPNHTAGGSQACVDCHETADAMSIHSKVAGGPCDICHVSSARVPVLPATTDCVNCHLAKSPVDPSHYNAERHAAVDGTETSGVACSKCHYLGMKPEHFKATSGPVTCVQCHELKVDAFTTAWDKTCTRCHATMHGTIAQAHTSTKTACGAVGCHEISNVANIHKGLPGSGCDKCHSGPATLPTTTDCGSIGCHPGITGDHEAAHDTTGYIDPGCYGCHFQSLTKEHSAIGFACATCHRSANAAVAAAIAGHTRNCSACHPAVNGKDYHAAQGTMEFISGNSSAHRVSSNLPGMRSSFRIGGTTYAWTPPAASSFLKAGWALDSVVTCDKCHSYSGSTGPHGATMKVNIDPSYPGDYQAAYLGGSSPTPSNIICAKCHTNFNGMNQVHATGDHQDSRNGKCVNCHSQIPHGWRLPRMLAYTTDPAPYRVATNGLQQISLKSRSASNWSDLDCYAACAGDHSHTVGTVWPSAVMTSGNLSVTVTDATGAGLVGATVTSDKGFSATTDAAGRVNFVGVETGTHSVTVAKTGYTSQTKTVVVANGQTASLSFSLALAPVAENFALSGSASASSDGGSWYSASKAFDGFVSTYWKSYDAGTEWLRVDLGSAKSVKKFAVNWNGSYYARAYRIETSIDGTNWTSRYSFTSSDSNSGGDTTVTLPSAVSARYVRLYCTSANYSTYQVAEFGVWNF